MQQICWIGYDNHNHELPEPAMWKTHALIGTLSAAGIEIKEKTIRKSWWEE